MTITRDTKGRFAKKAKTVKDLIPSMSAGARVQPTGLSSEDKLTGKLNLGQTLAGGRVTIDQAETFYGPFKTFVPPTNSEDDWRILDLDEQTLSRMPPWRLIQYLCDLSPDFSSAVWNFLRFANPGWECKVYNPGTTIPNKRSQAAIKNFLDTLTGLYGSPDVAINRLFISAFMRGAFMAELVLDLDGRTAIDLATPDPQTARFEKIPDTRRGAYWQLGQLQYQRGFTPITRPTVMYVPIDPFPGSPYGRAPAGAALFPTLFLLGMLHDLRRVVQQQGYPRIDLVVNLEALAQSAPEEVTNDPETFKAWVDAIIQEVKTVYQFLQPDDAYIHTSVIDVNRPVGATDARGLGAVDELIKMLERMAARGLKTMPILMGMVEGISEANANRQWEIQTSGVKSLQHLCETLLERLLVLVLQAQGLQGDVEFRFAEIRAALALRDAQTEQLVIGNNLAKYLNGWQSQDEAAMAATGHPAVEKEPLIMPTSQSFAQSNEEETKTTIAPTSPLQKGANGNQTPTNNPDGLPDALDDTPGKKSSKPVQADQQRDYPSIKSRR